MMTNFSRSLILLLCCLPLTSTLLVNADEVAMFYMTTTTVDGKVYATKLNGIIPYPKVYLDSRKMKVNYRSIGIDNIAGIRIEKRMETVDAIREYPSEPYSPSATPIYSLGGQKLTSDRHALQKGIYIIRGKKILVK